MPSKKPSHKNVGAKLRRMGLLPSGYKLGALTKNQKDRIRKIAHKYDQQLKHPTHYHTARVSGKTAHKLRQSEFGVHSYRGKHVAVIFKRDNETVTISGTRVVHRIVRDERTGQPIQGIRRTTLLSTRPGNIFEQAEAFFKRKRPGQFLMLRNNGHAPYNTHIYRMADFVAYMSHFKTLLNNQLPKLSKPSRYDRVREHLYVIEGYDNSVAGLEFDALFSREGKDEEEDGGNFTPHKPRKARRAKKRRKA